MSRNSGGTYSLPAGNPVVTGTLISSAWANTTLSDLATAMTDSLSRSGDGGMLAPLEAVDGTIGAPAYTFGNATTSGLYRAGAGDFRFSIAGADVFQLLAQGAGIANGAVATPGLFFISDPNTGLYRIGADNLGFTTAGTLRADVNSTGNWTLAAPTAGTALTINALAAEAGINIAAASGSNATIELTGTGGGYGWGLRSLNGGTFDIRNSTLSKTAISFSADAEPVVSINDAGTMREAGTKVLPSVSITASTTLSAAHSGRMVSANMSSGGQTVTLYAAGEGTTITINGNVNACTIAPGSGSLYWFDGSGSIASGNRTLAVGGIATVWRTALGDWYIWGVGLS